MRALLTLFATLALPQAAFAATLEVGPGKPYAAPCAALAAAAAGDTITVEAAGSYVGDVCSISTNGLTLRGVNGRPKIDAGNKISGDKGTWVVYGNDITIENFELFGAHSANGGHPADQNGAAIRAQGTNITVRGCYIHDNDNGFLNGSGTEGVGEVTIEGCEFAHNGFGDGYSHNVYVNHVAKLTFRFNYSHDVAEGHLLKSRADTNLVAYNRLTGEGGTDSYELNLPNGGYGYVIGNVIQQPTTSHNPGIISFAEEGSHTNGTPDELYVVNNTIVNDLGKGTFVTVGAQVTASTLVENNLFIGGGTVCSQATATLTTNLTSDPKLLNPTSFDYRLATGSPAVDQGTPPSPVHGIDLNPTLEYQHPTASLPRQAVGRLDIGAYEFGSPSSQGGTAGSPGSNGAAGKATGLGASAGGGTAGTAGTASGAVKAGNAGGSDLERAGAGSSPASPSTAPSSSGCGCRVTLAPGLGGGTLALSLGLAAIGLLRRRPRQTR